MRIHVVSGQAWVFPEWRFVKECMEVNVFRELASGYRVYP